MRIADILRCWLVRFVARILTFSFAMLEERNYEEFLFSYNSMNFNGGASHKPHRHETTRVCRVCNVHLEKNSFRQRFSSSHRQRLFGCTRCSTRTTRFAYNTWYHHRAWKMCSSCINYPYLFRWCDLLTHYFHWNGKIIWISIRTLRRSQVKADYKSRF